VREEAPEIGPHHALPTGPIPLIKFLQITLRRSKCKKLNESENQKQRNLSTQITNPLDVSGDALAIGDIKEVERVGGARCRLRLHLQWHVGVLDPCFSFQHRLILFFVETYLSIFLANLSLAFVLISWRWRWRWEQVRPVPLFQTIMKHILL
jgi:hypothetical protein